MGTVALQVVITEEGVVKDIRVLSPIGFGLDEQAQVAAQQWKFAPSTKDGKPVPATGIIEIAFKLPNLTYDVEHERQRTAFNLSVQSLYSPGIDEANRKRAVETMEDLARKKFPPAVFVAALWETKGNQDLNDPADPVPVIPMPLPQNFKPGLYEGGMRALTARDIPQDHDRGLAQLREASMWGSAQAQYFLGDHYEKGSALPHDPLHARLYFRLCAVHGDALCQFRLGSLLLAKPDRSDQDRIQAVALLQLAAERDVNDAKEIAAKETATLTPDQSARVAAIKSQFPQK